MTLQANNLSSALRWIWRGLGYGVLSIGCVLAVLASLGKWTSLGDYASQPPRTWERFDRTLVDQTSNVEDLFAVANERANGDLHKLPIKQAMQVLFKTTTDRFTHGVTMHTPFSNWILWSMGRIHPALGAIRDPENLLKHGSSALCGDISYTLMRLALKVGIRPRHVGLYGHVVMEAWYDGDWHMYDPDFEVVPADDSGSVLSVTALSRDERLIRKLYKGKSGGNLSIENVARIFMSREDNSFISYPAGSQFEWKSQVLLLMERAADFLKFIIPTMMILLGSAVLFFARSPKAKGL